MKLSKELKVGLLAVFSITVLYIGFNFLKGADLFSSTRSYYVVYDDIDGLTVSNAVMLNGLSVGRVQRIRLMPHRNNHLLVTIEVDEDIILGENSKAVLTDSDLLGGKTVNLEIGTITRQLHGEDTLIAEKAQGVADLLQQKAVPVLDNLDSTAVALFNLIRGFEGTAGQVRNTLGNLEQSSTSLRGIMDENRTKIGSITANMSTLSASLIESNRQLQPILAKVNNFADTLNHMELAKAVDNANRSMEDLNRLLTKINQGQGSLGKLANNDSLYNNLNHSSQSLDNLLRDVKTNPGRYINISVFGRNRNRDQEQQGQGRRRE